MRPLVDIVHPGCYTSWKRRKFYYFHTELVLVGELPPSRVIRVFGLIWGYPKVMGLLPLRVTFIDIAPNPENDPPSLGPEQSKK